MLSLVGPDIRWTSCILSLPGHPDRCTLSPPAPESGGGEEQADAVAAGVPGRGDQREPPPG